MTPETTEPTTKYAEALRELYEIWEALERGEVEVWLQTGVHVQRTILLDPSRDSACPVRIVNTEDSTHSFGVEDFTDFLDYVDGYSHMAVRKLPKPAQKPKFAVLKDHTPLAYFTDTAEERRELERHVFVAGDLSVRTITMMFEPLRNADAVLVQCDAEGNEPVYPVKSSLKDFVRNSGSLFRVLEYIRECTGFFRIEFPDTPWRK